jgi:hypothetical protein
MERKKGSGGRRTGAGRKSTGWVKVGYTLETDTVELLRSYAEKTGKPQNQLINDLVKAHFTSNPISQSL